ncbi:MAG TPA: hypothetical protein VMU40_13950 [Steroidobacteraceae bacterium]|nr:hypothetical protein [Steroidobacteraceae bacterium]
MQDFRIPILLEEHYGLARQQEPVRLGVPLPRGLLRDPSQAMLVDALEQPLPWQGRALALWPDGSIKWLLIDLLATLGALERASVRLRPARQEGQEGGSAGAFSLELQPRGLTCGVATGRAIFEVGGARGMLLGSARVDGVDLLGAQGARLRLLGCSGREYEAVADRVCIEEPGRLCSTVLIEGRFQSSEQPSPLVFKSRLSFLAGSSSVRCEIQLRNPQAARHPGGLWDLDDQGTILFEDVSLFLAPAGEARELHWYAEDPARMRTQLPVDWSLYQDSSGGENWDSINHIDGKGEPTVTFRGYRVQSRDPAGPMLIADGDRAAPCLLVSSERGCIAATALEFWQNFPKALRWEQGTFSVGLFPHECRAPFALQGGEQKSHAVVLEFGASGAQTTIPQRQRPLAASVDPDWIEHSGAIEDFVAARCDQNAGYLRYINAIVEGPHAFAAKREIIDEFGWRNFGDLYADHEGVRHEGSRPLVSHYNNQYDFLYGALVHFLRTGDDRWRQLAVPAAQHTIDIDIYHTDQDKAAFNHGLFWHTDHYMPAATCTHRTYSRHNGTAPSYGGGPSNEHNYTSGLLLHYFLTGDPEAKAAVLELGNWVIAMDDGSRSALGLLDASPTGLASQTVVPTYHKVGRGAGNSINALLDAYRASGDRTYLDKAEELLRRCIHPADDIEALELREPETRWSYLVFLQVLGRYLHLKLEWGELNYCFHYARASLLHYARWMLEHEVPYKEVLHKVELPTETWPAHDMRKCHVLHLAGEFADSGERDAFHERAAYFFERSLADTVSFPTAFLTRPLVILCGCGYVHAYFQAHQELQADFGACPYGFGSPEAFTPQKGRWRGTLPAKVRLLCAQLARASAEKLDVLGRYTTPWRT